MRTATLTRASVLAVVFIGWSCLPARAVGPPYAPAPGSPFGTGGSQPRYIVTGDYDEDGATDLVVSNQASDTLTVLRSRDDGQFHPGPGSPQAVGGSHPVTEFAGDFNGDGHLDVAVGNVVSSNVSVLLGDGDGALVPVTGSPFPVGLAPTGLTAGDFDGNGSLDVATANSVTSTVSVLRNDGTGRLVATGPQVSSGGLGGTELASGDFDGDGDRDVAVVNTVTNNIGVLRNNGSGHLQLVGGLLTPPLLTQGLAPLYIAAADMNTDGAADLAVANSGSSTVAVLLSDGDLTFTPAPGSPTASGGIGPTALAIGDVDRNGTLDVAVAGLVTSDVSVLQNDGTGRLSLKVGTPVPSGGLQTCAVVIARLDADEHPDLAAASILSSNLSILLATD